MQGLEDKLQTYNEDIDAVKEKVKAGAKEIERLRVERGEAEKMVKQSKSEEEDARVVRLYDWCVNLLDHHSLHCMHISRYTAALRLHRNLHSLASFTSPSENELHLVYDIHPTSADAVRQHVTIVLLFVPNTRQLGDIQVTGLPSNVDLSDVIGAHIQANDVPGLIAAVLEHAR